MTKTKQQQLEYAAKHIEKWKSGYDYAVIEETIDGHLYVRWPSICTSGITKKDWQQERDKMSSKPEDDNSWHDRGELPPAGHKCVLYVAGNNGEEVTFIGVTSDSYPVFETSDKLVLLERGKYEFRPLRTEREKSIDEMLLAIDHIKEGNFETLIGALYDAGYRKINP